jgi:uncharacterized membrane protein
VTGPAQPRARHIAATIGGLALIGIVLLLPDIARRPAQEREAVTAFHARIVDIQPPRTNPQAELPPVPLAHVVALDGDKAGQTLEAYLSGPGGSQIVAGYRPGDEVVVTITQSPDEATPFVAVSDRWRIPYLESLGVLFGAVVLVIGGWRGARALVALGLTIAVILKVLLPLVINGVAPLPLAVMSASAVTIATIVLTEGWRRSSLAAILGTTGALALTGLIGAVATGVMAFTYTAGSDLAFLTTASGGGLDLRGLLLAAFILGAVGVLDDVTVTQAVLVDELVDKGRLGGRDLFFSAMSVGRSHIGATINTLFLAYVGAGLPLLVVLLVSQQPTALVLNDEEIATEIVRTLVGSIGIVAAVPLTTFIAVLLAESAGATADERAGVRDRRPIAVAGIGAMIAALLAATIVLPLTSGSTTPLTPTVLDPGASFLAASPVPGAGGSPQPSEVGGSEPPGEPALAARGQALPLAVDGEQVGTATVLKWTIAEDPRAPNGDTIRVSVRYRAVAPLDPSSGRWELLLADGSELPLDPIGAGGLGGPLAAGETRTVALSGSFPKSGETPFIAYVDDAGSIPYAIPVE